MNHSGHNKKVPGKSSLGQGIDMKNKDEIRRHAPSPAPSEDNKSLTPQEIKRRAQNRASQRAFRERKRTHAETLQQQVDKMQQIYDELFASYRGKEKEVSDLCEKIQNLEYKIQVLGEESSTLPALASTTPCQFEPVVFDDPFDPWSAALFQTPMGWDSDFQQPSQLPNGQSFSASATSMDSTI